VSCHSQILKQRWKCLNKLCCKYDWCTNCMKVQGSVRGLCSHDHLMNIPSSRVKSLCKVFKPGNLRGGDTASSPSHNCWRQTLQCS
jgi:hypothetical protein